MTSQDKVRYIYNEIATVIQNARKEQISEIEIAAALAIVIVDLKNVDMEELAELAIETKIGSKS